MNKRLAILVAGLLLAFIALVPSAPVPAADNDTLDVTFSGAYLECNIINATWAIGTVQMSTSYWTNSSDTQVADVTNCTQGTNIDFEMNISTSPATWYSVWFANVTTGADQFKLNASDDVWTTQTALENTTRHDVANNHDPVADITFDLRFDSPTSTTTGAAQSMTLTGIVTIH